MEIICKTIQNLDFNLCYPKYLNDNKESKIEMSITLTIYNQVKVYEIILNQEIIKNMHDIVKNDLVILLELLHEFLISDDPKIIVNESAITLNLIARVLKKEIIIPLTLPLKKVSPEEIYHQENIKLRLFMKSLEERVEVIENLIQNASSKPKKKVVEEKSGYKKSVNQTQTRVNQMIAQEKEQDQLPKKPRSKKKKEVNLIEDNEIVLSD